MTNQKQIRTALYIGARAELRKLDSKMSIHALATLARAVVDQGIAFRNRDGRVIFSTE